MDENDIRNWSCSATQKTCWDFKGLFLLLAYQSMDGNLSWNLQGHFWNFLGEGEGPQIGGGGGSRPKRKFYKIRIGYIFLNYHNNAFLSISLTFLSFGLSFVYFSNRDREHKLNVLSGIIFRMVRNSGDTTWIPLPKYLLPVWRLINISPVYSIFCHSGAILQF